MIKQYEYKVGNFSLSTREAARMVQRSLKATQADPTAPAPKITQKLTQTLTMERIVR